MTKDSIHKKARTTHMIREEIQKSSLSSRELSFRYKITRRTVRKWKSRESVHDRSHQPRQLQTILTTEQERVIVYLRKIFLLPLDDLFLIVQAFVNPSVSRSGLHRCLCRYHISGLNQIKEASSTIFGTTKASPEIFREKESGVIDFVVKDISKLTEEAKRGYLFVAINRAHHWVYLEILKDKKTQSVRSFHKRLCQKAPFRIDIVTAVDGNAFAEYLFASSKCFPTEPIRKNIKGSLISQQKSRALKTKGAHRVSPMRP
jgi:hypothetical protein